MPLLSDEATQQGQVPKGILGSTILRPAIPNGVLVQLEELGCRAAVHYGAEATVADRQGSCPFCGRSRVVEVEMLMFHGKGIMPSSRCLAKWQQCRLGLWSGSSLRDRDSCLKLLYLVKRLLSAAVWSVSMYAASIRVARTNLVSTADGLEHRAAFPAERGLCARSCVGI